jgi:hypothetical protein
LQKYLCENSSGKTTKIRREKETKTQKNEEKKIDLSFNKKITSRKAAADVVVAVFSFICSRIVFLSQRCME